MKSVTQTLRQSPERLIFRSDKRLSAMQRGQREENPEKYTPRGRLSNPEFATKL